MKTSASTRLLIAPIAGFALAALPAGVAQEPAPAPAATAPAATGIFSGRVYNNATGSYLRDAEVRDIETGRSATTDVDGSFSLTLPAGSRKLRVTYFGLEGREVSVVITAGERSTQEIGLQDADYGETISLEAFVVAGEKEGRAAAVSRQKEAENMVTMISSDEFANVSGGNVGDFLRNVPGFSIEYSGDDPRSISVRGQDPNMNTVTVNGMRSANAASGNANRQFELDQISLQDVESVEIFKAPPASMDADSGGGTVNMTSKSAFKTKGRRINYTVLANAKSNALTFDQEPMPDHEGTFKIRPSVALSYSEAFLNNRLGVAVNGNFNETYSHGVTVAKNYRMTSTRDGFEIVDPDTVQGGDPTTGTPTNRDPSTGAYLYDINGPRGIYPTTFSYGLSPGLTTRGSFALNLDFKLSESTTLWARSQVNTSLISGGGQTLELGVASPNIGDTNQSSSVGTDWSATHWTAHPADAGFEQRSGNTAKVSGEYLYKRGTGTTISIGADQKFENWKINYAAQTSLSTNHYDNKGDMPVPQVEMFLRGIGYTVDAGNGTNYPSFVQTHGPDLHDLSNYVDNMGTATSSRVSGSRVRTRLDDAGNVILLNRDTSIYPVLPPAGSLVYDFPLVFGPDGVGSITKTAGGFSNSANRAVLTYPEVSTASADNAPLRLRNSRRVNSKDIFNTAKVDIRRSFQMRIPFYLQAGAQVRQQNRDIDKWGQTRWNYTGDAADKAAFAAAAAAAAANVSNADALLMQADANMRAKLSEHLETFKASGYPQPAHYTVPNYNLDAINKFFLANPDLFTEDVAWRLETERSGLKSIQERVTAGYAMGNFNLGSLGVLAGVRYEVTEGSGTGAIADNEAARDAALNQLLAHVQSKGYATISDAWQAAVSPTADYHAATMFSHFRVDAAELARIRYARRQKLTQSYDDFFPNLQMKYTLTDSLILRASYNKTIGRQNFENIIPGYSVTPPGGEEIANVINATNPLLKPVYFDNFEVRLERYLAPSGLFEATAYYKDVKNYVIESEETIAAGVDYGYDLSAYTGDTLRRRINGGNGTIWGIEAGYQQGLGTFVESLKPFTVSVNYTYQKGESTASYDGSPTSATLPMLRFVPRLLNSSITFREGPYKMSLTYNWKDDMPRALTFDSLSNQAMITYEQSRATLDLSASYTFYKRHTFFLEVKNLTNEPVRQYLVKREWMRSYNVYGATIFAGFKGSF
jgi:outer membrane receptor protein involved in Fe transport